MATGDDRGHQGPDRFQDLWQANFAKVTAFVARRSASSEDAADCVSETFAIAWRKLPDVPDGGDALYWLYGVARRVLANQRRAHGRRRALMERFAWELDRSVPVWDLPMDALALEAATALASLGDEDREILRLVSWEGLDSEGIAKTLGCSSATARVRLHRARKRLMNLLNQVSSATVAGSGTSTDKESTDRPKDRRE